MHACTSWHKLEVEPSELQKDWNDLALLLERNRRRQAGFWYGLELRV